MNEAIPIQSRDYWFKVIEMLQQNWVGSGVNDLSRRNVSGWG